MAMTRIRDTVGRYLVRGEVLYIFCGGTNTATDRRRNLRTRRVAALGGRVNQADLEEAELIFRAVTLAVDLSDIRLVAICGFSRGGAVAQLLWLLIGAHLPVVRALELYAPKRTMCRQLPRKWGDLWEATAYRFDVVPFLPPWYAGIPIVWQTRPRLTDAPRGRWWFEWMLPWKAHEQSARDFARARHEAGKDVNAGDGMRANPVIGL